MAIEAKNVILENGLNIADFLSLIAGNDRLERAVAPFVGFGLLKNSGTISNFNDYYPFELGDLTVMNYKPQCLPSVQTDQTTGDFYFHFDDYEGFRKEFMPYLFTITSIRINQPTDQNNFRLQPIYRDSAEAEFTKWTNRRIDYGLAYSSTLNNTMLGMFDFPVGEVYNKAKYMDYGLQFYATDSHGGMSFMRPGYYLLLCIPNNLK